MHIQLNGYVKRIRLTFLSLFLSRIVAACLLSTLTWSSKMNRILIWQNICSQNKQWMSSTDLSNIWPAYFKSPTFKVANSQLQVDISPMCQKFQLKLFFKKSQLRLTALLLQALQAHTRHCIKNIESKHNIVRTRMKENGKPALWRVVLDRQGEVPPLRPPTPRSPDPHQPSQHNA